MLKDERLTEWKGRGPLQMRSEASTGDTMEDRSTTTAATHECLISRRDDGSLSQSNINTSITLWHLPPGANKQELNNEWATFTIMKLKYLPVSHSRADVGQGVWFVLLGGLSITLLFFYVFACAGWTWQVTCRLQCFQQCVYEPHVYANIMVSVAGSGCA